MGVIPRGAKSCVGLKERGGWFLPIPMSPIRSTGGMLVLCVLGYTAGSLRVMHVLGVLWDGSGCRQVGLRCVIHRRLALMQVWLLGHPEAP